MAFERAACQDVHITTYVGSVPTQPVNPVVTLSVDGGATFQATAVAAITELYGVYLNIDASESTLWPYIVVRVTSDNCDDRIEVFYFEDAWKAAIAAGLEDFITCVIDTGTVNATTTPTRYGCRFDSAQPGGALTSLYGHGQTILWTSGANKGLSRTVIEYAYRLLGGADMHSILWYPALPTTPSASDGFVILNVSAERGLDPFIGYLTVVTVTTQTSFTVRWLRPSTSFTIPTNRTTAGITDCFLLPTPDASYVVPDLIAQIGPSRRITAITDSSGTGTVTLESAFGHTLVDGDVLAVFAGVPTMVVLTPTTQDTIDALGPGTGDNAVTITVTDGSTPLSGVVVHVRTTSGGADVYAQSTNVSGKVIFNLDSATYYMQASLNGYTHTEAAVVISTDPQSVSITMSGNVIAAPADEDVRRIYAYAKDLDDTTNTDDDRPLFVARLNVPCLTSDGVILEQKQDATLHDDDYWYVDLIPQDSLTAQDGHNTPKYSFQLRNGKTLQRDVLVATAATENLIDL